MSDIPSIERSSPIKILLPNHFPLEGSGSGVYTENLARALVKRGHQVQVIVPEQKPLLDREFGIRTILFSPDRREREGYLPFNFPCFTTHPRSETTFYQLNQQQMNTYIQTMVEVIQEEVDRFQPQIIHCQHLWLTPYAARKTGLPYLITAHGTDLRGFIRDQRYHPYVIPGALGARKIIAVSRQVQEESIQLYGVKKENVQRVMNGFDQKIFYPHEGARERILKELGLRDETTIICFAGKLAHFKGVDTLLQAAAIYEEVLDPVVTLIIGQGEKKKELLRLKEELQLTGVHFLGHLPQERLAAHYSAAHVFVVPSRVEPFGLVAIEALACGTPVVASRAGGLPDFIHEEVGALFMVDDVADLTEKIIKEVKNPKREEKGRQAQVYASRGFSWEKVALEVEKIYRRIL